MFEYKKIQIINQPLSKVFPFFESPENLEEITPKNIGFKIKTPKLRNFSTIQHLNPKKGVFTLQNQCFNCNILVFI